MSALYDKSLSNRRMHPYVVRKMTPWQSYKLIFQAVRVASSSATCVAESGADVEANTFVVMVVVYRMQVKVVDTFNLPLPADTPKTVDILHQHGSDSVRRPQSNAARTHEASCGADSATSLRAETASIWCPKRINSSFLIVSSTC